MPLKNNPNRLKKVVIREELVILTGNYIEALIVDQLLYWSERTSDTDKFLEEERRRNPELDIPPMHGWIYKSAEELSDELMIGASPATMRRYIIKLVEKGYIEQRNNPNHKWDRRLQYRPNILKLQYDLQQLGFALHNYPLLLDDNPFFKMKNAFFINENGNSNLKNQNPQNEKAISEPIVETTKDSISLAAKSSLPENQPTESDSLNDSGSPNPKVIPAAFTPAKSGPVAPAKKRISPRKSR